MCRSERLDHELKLANTLADVREFVKEGQWAEVVRIIAADEYHSLYHSHLGFKSDAYHHHGWGEHGGGAEEI